MDHELKLVEQPLLEQGANQCRTATHPNVLSGLLLQLVDFFRKISFDQSWFLPFPPLDLIESR